MPAVLHKLSLFVCYTYSDCFYDYNQGYLCLIKLEKKIYTEVYEFSLVWPLAMKATASNVELIKLKFDKLHRTNK